MSGRPHVLLVCGSLRLGGTERHMQLLAHRLDRRRFRVSLAVISPVFELEGGVPDDVAVHVLHDRRTGAGAIRRLVRDEAVNVVYCCDPDSGYFAMIGAAGRRVRRVVGRRGFQPEHTVKQRLAQYTLLATAHAVTVNSRALLVTLPRHQRRRARVVPNGVDLDRISTVSRDESRRRFGGHPEDALVVGTIARLHPSKGIDVLLDSFADVRASIPTARLTVVGGGPQQDALERQAARLGIAGAVAMTGGRSDAVDALPGFDLFVLPSRSESFPNALLEASAHGRPSVATSVGGVVDLVTAGETGWLAPPEDPAGLTAAVLAALARPDREEVGARAAEVVRSCFELGRTIRRFEELFEVGLSP